jgi:hypothetical protein
LKTAYYTLAAVGLAIAGLALVLSSAPTRRVLEAVRPRPKVFVDVNKLVSLHPSSRTLAAMKSALATIRVDSSPMPHATASLGSRVHPGVETDAAGVASRQALESEIAQAAVSAFSRLESEQRQVLESRLGVARATEMESAESEIEVQARDITRDQQAKVRDANAQSAAELANVQMGLGSLKLAENLEMRLVAQGRIPDVHPLLVQNREQLQARLKAVDDKRAEEAQASESIIQKSIDDLRLKAAAGIDAELADRERGEQKRIEDEVTGARNEVLAELSSFDSTSGPVAFAAACNAPALARVTVAASTLPALSGAHDLALIRVAVSALEKRMRLDVVRTVQQLAAQNRMRVTFTNRGGSVADGTQVFARLLRARAWADCGPILVDERGS